MNGCAGRLNASQKNHLLSSCKHLDQLLAEIEHILAGSERGAVFPRYRRDLSPAQVRAARDYLTRIRSVLLRTLQSQGIAPPIPPFGALHSIRVTLNFALVDVEECRPERMRGYGELDPAVVPELEGILSELGASIEKMDRFLKGGEAEDLRARAEEQTRLRPEMRILADMERIIREYGLVEFRSALGLVLDRLEDESFEIAVFGRVSSGKSSLLNALIGAPVLPVGVNPITTVPTRIVSGPQKRLRVWRAARPPEDLEIELLAEYATEQQNPGNIKQVARISLTLPSDRVPAGVVLVDTPGVGTIATAGALETVAYLPKCDYGIVLIDAGSTLSEDELTLIRTLSEYGIVWSVLLSKADLLDSEDLMRVLDYTADRLRAELSVEPIVHAVSTRPERLGMLNAWVEQEILPLYTRRDEVRVKAIHHRMQLLREGLLSTLQARYAAESADRPPAAMASEDAERTLRLANAEIDRVRDRCVDAAQEIRKSGPAAIRLLATEAVRQHRNGDGAAINGLWFASVLRTVVAADANEIATRLRELSHSLAAALSAASASVELPDAPVKGELAGAIREMPVFDPGEIAFVWSPSRILSLLPELETRRLRSSLEKEAGPRIEEACASYAALLERWVRRTIGQMSRLFDSYADTIRGRLRSPSLDRSIAPDRLAADLALLDPPLTPSARVQDRFA